MTVKAASEGALGELHSKVAKVMSNALDVVEKAQEHWLEGDADEPRPEVSAPLLSAITKFLNDNKISCVPEDSKEMSDLEKRLMAKRKTSVGNVVHAFPQE